MENILKREFKIERIFNAPPGILWKMWTEPELVMKWWGPEQFTSPVVKIDLRVGGKYLYCMRGSSSPGQPIKDFWSGGVYKEIIPQEKIVCTDSFTDEKGNIVEPVVYGMPAAFPREGLVTFTFEAIGDNQKKVTILYATESEAVLEAMLKVQMKEGWENSLEKLAKNLK